MKMQETLTHPFRGELLNPTHEHNFPTPLNALNFTKFSTWSIEDEGILDEDLRVSLLDLIYR